MAGELGALPGHDYLRLALEIPQLIPASAGLAVSRNAASARFRDEFSF
jgi:hypothetical protein